MLTCLELGGGIGRAEMYYRSNIIFIVGGGPSPVRPLEKVMIWDDSRTQFISEVVVESAIKSIRVNKEK